MNLRISDCITKEDLTKFQIQSYDWLIKRGLQEVIDDVGKVEVDIEGVLIKFGKIRVGDVTDEKCSEEIHTPFECRLRNLTYSAPLYLEVTQEFGGKRETIETDIGHLPIMIGGINCLTRDKSREDRVKMHEDAEDLGGYFIINGTERILIIVEDLAQNRIETTIEDAHGKKTPTAKVFSVRRGFRSRITVERKESKTGETLFVGCPGFPTQIPLVTLMKALGLEEKDILKLFDSETDNETLPEILVNTELDKFTPEEAFSYLGKRVGAGHSKQYQIIKANQVINAFLLPHIGNTADDWRNKARYLAIMAKKVIELNRGKRQSDDKDHYSNKRLRLAGDMLQELFRVSFNTLCKDIKFQIEKQHARRREINVGTAIRRGTLSERIDFAIATGNWTGGRTGISQVLDNINYIASIAHRRRVVSLLSRSHPHFEARDLHATHWGRICPNETPEGQNCGLVKNLAISSRISLDYDDADIAKQLYSFGVKKIE